MELLYTFSRPQTKPTKIIGFLYQLSQIQVKNKSVCYNSRTLKDQEHHNYWETPKIFYFYASIFYLTKKLLQSFIIDKRTRKLVIMNMKNKLEKHNYTK
jgi:hypothetical protein